VGWLNSTLNQRRLCRFDSGWLMILRKGLLCKCGWETARLLIILVRLWLSWERSRLDSVSRRHFRRRGVADFFIGRQQRSGFDVIERCAAATTPGRLGVRLRVVHLPLNISRSG